MSDTETCEGPGCGKPARAAVRTTRPSRGDMRVTLYADNRHAPKVAMRYCHACVVTLMRDVTATLVDGDDTNLVGHGYRDQLDAQPVTE